jgi:hypothetical protein
MANALYDAGREAFLGGDADWDANDIRAVLTDHADDNPNVATDDNLDDIASAARVAVSSAMTGKTKTAGVADCDDFSFTSVTGDQSESITWYKHTGTESTSTLLAKVDTATGLPVTPNGANINVTIDSGSNKLFKL